MNAYKNKKHMNCLEKPEIKCHDIEELYGELREGELPLTLSGRLEEHLDNCEECQIFIGNYESIILEAKKLRVLEAEIPRDAKRRLHAVLNNRLGLDLPV